MKEIVLTRGKCAVVDDEDYEYLNQWKWRALRAVRKTTEVTWYAFRTTARPNRKSVYMHREVIASCGFTECPQCDHADSDGLNNQRKNLRSSTANQNHWNRRKSSGCTSQFKGVYWNRKFGKWMARIFCLGKHHYLGMFVDESEAAKAYDTASVHYFGEFARINIK